MSNKRKQWARLFFFSLEGHVILGYCYFFVLKHCIVGFIRLGMEFIY